MVIQRLQSILTGVSVGSLFGMTTNALAAPPRGIDGRAIDPTQLGELIAGRARGLSDTLSGGDIAPTDLPLLTELPSFTFDTTDWVLLSLAAAALLTGVYLYVRTHRAAQASKRAHGGSVDQTEDPHG